MGGGGDVVLEQVGLARRVLRGLGVRGTGGEIAARAVAGDGEQPCGEAVAVLEGDERAEAADERLLHDIVGLVRVQLGKAGGETRYGGAGAGGGTPPPPPFPPGAPGAAGGPPAGRPPPPPRGRAGGG